MRTLARFLSLSAFAVSGVSLLAPEKAWLRLVLFVPKLFVTAFMPLFAVLGLQGCLLGRIGGDDARTSAFGLLGTSIPDDTFSDTSVHGGVSYYGPPDLLSLYHRFIVATYITERFHTSLA